MKVEWERWAKYGGVHFTQLAPAREINAFVDSLPEEDRESMFEVMKRLHQNGYIRIENDEQFVDADFEIHP
jgi:hypothetical protein